ncbi:hypothetical protein DL769_011047 [Monosporascus sp. CRB-8-3]|nr:hypothetical protein DL769_011047 [Monosporascus sp. CRB-8-3]
MVKIIPSTSRELGKARLKIEELEDLNSKLKYQIAILKARLAIFEKVDAVPSLSPTQSDKSQYRVRGGLKRYERETTASRNRSTRPETCPQPCLAQPVISVGEGRYVYEDGAPVKLGPTMVQNWDLTPRYQAQTRAAEGKRKPYVNSPRGRLRDWPCRNKVSQNEADNTKTVETEDYAVTSDRNEGGAELSDPESPSEDTESSENEMLIELELSSELEPPSEDEPPSEGLPSKGQTLEERSRLRDSSWLSGPAGHVHIPSKTVCRLLRKAFCLAQESFYYAARKHWRDTKIWYGNFTQGPHEVLFGYSELERRIGERWHEYSMDFLANGGFSASDVVSALFDMPTVRNKVCHFGGRCSDDLKTYDSDLTTCQKLAVTLKDERRAFKIRQLRDQLRVEAEKVLAEIESLQDLATLPYARPWKRHHVKAFRDLELSTDEDMPETIVRAAETWSWRFRRFED